MTNRLELSWKLDGFVDEQRYYCSETTIDINNLPTPKAIIPGEYRVYTDTLIQTGKTYYIRLGAYRNGTEKIGDEFVVSTSIPSTILIVGNAPSLKIAIESLGYNVAMKEVEAVTQLDIDQCAVMIGVLYQTTSPSVAGYDLLNYAKSISKPFICARGNGISSSNLENYWVKISGLCSTVAGTNTSTLRSLSDYQSILSNASIEENKEISVHTTSSYTHWSTNLASGSHNLFGRSQTQIACAVFEPGTMLTDGSTLTSKAAFIGFGTSNQSDEAKRLWGAIIEYIRR